MSRHRQTLDGGFYCRDYQVCSAHHSFASPCGSKNFAHYKQYETSGIIESCDLLIDQYLHWGLYYDSPSPASDSPVILDFIEVTEVEDSDYDLVCVGEARVTDREKASFRLTYTLVKEGAPLDVLLEKGYMGVEIE